MSVEEVPASYQRKLTSRRAELTTLRACAREFMTHFSPRAALAAIVLTLLARIYVGEWSWHELVIPVALIASQPFVEWLIHKYLLHLPAFELRGRRIELYGSIQHRNHHLDPSNLDRVLLKPVEVVSFLVQIAVVIGLMAAGLALASGWSFLPLALTGLVFAYAGLLRYEWSHFLIHTPYVPRTRSYRAIWRNHRLHHFKHEDYWMGVSSNLGDRVLGTNPDQRTISKSPTARTLDTRRG